MLNNISTELRKKFFDLISRDSSPDFREYLRIYESLPRPSQESFEVSCELVNGVRVDAMRLAILDLHREDILRWVSACRLNIPLIQGLVSDDTTEAIFGIGLADYPSGAGICRMKIYDHFGRHQTQDRRFTHIKHVFSLLNVPTMEFMRDWERFKKMDLIGLDWNREGQPSIKVYFGHFPMEQLFRAPCEALSKEEMVCYDNLRQRGLLPETFQICVRYSPAGRCSRIDLHCQTRNFVPYLKIFDHEHAVSKFFKGFYKIFPELRLQVISLQWDKVQKMQFYFQLRR